MDMHMMDYFQQGSSSKADETENREKSEGLKRVKKTNILYIEDNPDDLAIIDEMLEEKFDMAYSLAHADLLATGLERLGQGGVDIILLDLSLPDSHGFTTFQEVKKGAKNLPVIVMTGLDDETTARKAVQEGAQDYLVKGQVTANLLMRAIRYAIEREKLVVKLRESLEQIKTLRGFIPICASCKKIRNDQGFWQQVEVYVSNHTEAEFSHGICPGCIKTLYPEFADEILKK
jgi:CheY-like chemotaxis protein